MRPSLRMAAMLMSAAASLAQQPAQQQPYVFKSESHVVNVLATVRDRDGRLQSNLTENDFRIEEDGRPQVIKYFSKETNLPLTLGLLVDTSNSQRRLLGEERSASLEFLRASLREDRDQAFVLHFDSELELMQDLTSSRQKLNAALAEVDQSRDDASGGWHRRNGGSTSLYDAVYVSADEVLKKQTGRKALILLTDGVDTSSRTTLDRAIQQCIQNDTMVYSILFADDAAYGGHGIIFGGGGGGWGGGWGSRRGGWGGPRFPQHGGDGKKVLTELAEKTGGHFFEVSKKQSLENIYRQIEDELRSQYNLGYQPDPRTPGYHRIKVTTANANYRVQARDSYYAGENETSAATAKPAK